MNYIYKIGIIKLFIYINTYSFIIKNELQNRTKWANIKRKNLVIFTPIFLRN